MQFPTPAPTTLRRCARQHGQDKITYRQVRREKRVAHVVAGDRGQYSRDAAPRARGWAWEEVTSRKTRRCRHRAVCPATRPCGLALSRAGHHPEPFAPGRMMVRSALNPPAIVQAARS